ncbi:MAG: SRPBCC family protein [Bacteroidetes bacterium]|nr:SRPBCC family protein [Bacteroidota bacterium]
MRYIKLFLISAVVLFLVVVLLSGILPSHIRISRAINIGAPKLRVYNTVSDFSTWRDWNGFVSNSPLTNISLSSPSTGKGAYLNSGQLKISIDKCTPDSITTTWQQVKAKNFTGGYNMMQLVPDSVTVQWYFDFHFSWYPWEKFTSLVYDKQLGTVMEESLMKLKQVSENSK